jgi:hypothetical protein
MPPVPLPIDTSSVTLIVVGGAKAPVQLAAFLFDVTLSLDAVARVSLSSACRSV